jgi:hypothetical protein
VAAASEPVVFVLKGLGTVVSDRRYFLNTTGNPGMATGGAGDVLTGVIAALLAQQQPAFDAAQLGSFVHGLAGGVDRDHRGESPTIAADLIEALPDAFIHMMSDPEFVIRQATGRPRVHLLGQLAGADPRPAAVEGAPGRGIERIDLQAARPDPSGEPRLGQATQQELTGRPSTRGKVAGSVSPSFQRTTARQRRACATAGSAAVSRAPTVISMRSIMRLNE